MIEKTEAIAIEQQRASNLDYLQSDIKETIQRLQKLKRLEKQVKEFSLGDAIALIEYGKTLDPIDETNIFDKLSDI